MTAIAIDGPAGAGKSSVAKATARALGFRYVDTGAMYRAIAVAALDAGLDLEDEDALRSLVDNVRLEVAEDHVLLNGNEVGDRIRTGPVSDAAARVAQHAAVRSALVDLQRRLARQHDVVMEGRDIGTEVLPDADIKIYLTASLAERARRRGRQLAMEKEGDACRRLEDDIAARDERDRTRAVSPLLQAPDAVLVDSTDASPEEVVAAIVALASDLLPRDRPR